MGNRLGVWISRLALAQLVGAAVLFWGARALGQSSELVNDRVARLGDQVRALESVAADARLRVLESDMSEVKYLGRAVAVAVAAQLLLAGMGARERRRG